MSMIVRRVLRGAYSVDARQRYVPDLVASARTTTRPFAVTYRIRQAARWSDGTPITAGDFVFTWRVVTNPRLDVTPALRDAYAVIRRATILGPKRVRFVLGEPRGDWKSLFDLVLPRHALVGQDIATVWRDRIDNPRTGRPIASGPFMFARWSRGVELEVHRNPAYYGKKANLDRLLFRFVRGDAAQIQAVRAGTIGVTSPLVRVLPRSERPLVRVRALRGLTFGWEHIDFNLGPKGHPALRRRVVRQAIASGIDRDAVVARVHARVLPGVTALQSTGFMPFESPYRANFRRWRYRPATAARLLRSNGCTRAQDGIFRCREGRLSFRFVSTSGDQLRELAFELIQTQLRRAGIEIRKEFAPNLDPVFEGDWDIALFAWVRGLDPARFNAAVYSCRADLNVSRYCNGTVSRLLGSAARELRSGRRAALVNRADAQLARDLPTLPLVVKPAHVAHDRRIRNIVWNPLDFLWSVRDWWISSR